MNQQRDPQTLAQWAEIFREEGDIDTADAIELQLQRARERTLDHDDAEWLQLVLERARRLDRRGDYEAAIESYDEALQVVENALGGSHPEIIERLSDLARCQLNAGRYAPAWAYYSRLLCLVLDAYGSEDALAATVRHHMRFCQRSIREGIGSARLQNHINNMLRRSRGQLAVAAAARAERMRGVAWRLVGRGRTDAAVRLHEAAIKLQLGHAPPEGEARFAEIHRHAIDLKDAGQPGRVAAVLAKLVAMRNLVSDSTDQGPQLREALMDASACLCAQGQARSTQELVELADLIAKRYQGDVAADAA